MRWTILLFFMFSLKAAAGDWDSVKRSCGDRASLHGTGVHWLEECAEDIFTLRPVHLAINSIAPGSGLGVGATFGLIPRKDRWEFPSSLSYVRSTDGSSLVQGSFTIAAPPFSLKIDNDSTSVLTAKISNPDGTTTEVPIQDQGYHDTRSRERPQDTRGGGRIALVRDYWQVDSKLSFTFSGQWMDLKRQDFYGLGPLTSQSGLAFYGLRQTSAKFAVNDPITTFAELGFETEFVRPEVRSVVNASRPSIEQLYTPTTAPGLSASPDFVRYEPYVRFRLPVKSRYLRLTEFKVGYAFYHDLADSAFSFRRIKASVRSEHDVRLPNNKTASLRSAWANFLCPVGRSRKYCTAGTLALNAEVSAAYTGTGSVVPFYLDETLGGADIYGNDTLRGFVDYRFRGPSRMLFQAEFRHRVWGPFGLYTFADSGKVAQTSADLVFEHMRHDYGIGMYISATNRIVLRAYLGFGSREGIRPNFKPAAL